MTCWVIQCHSCRVVIPAARCALVVVYDVAIAGPFVATLVIDDQPNLRRWRQFEDPQGWEYAPQTWSGSRSTGCSRAFIGARKRSLAQIRLRRPSGGDRQGGAIGLRPQLAGNPLAKGKSQAGGKLAVDALVKLLEQLIHEHDADV